MKPRQVLPKGVHAPDMPPIEAEIERLDLAEHIAELDALGLCIVPLAKLSVDADFVDRTIQALLEVAERRTGVAFDLEKGPAGALPRSIEQNGQLKLTHLLLEGPLFEDLFVNPVRKTMMRHLLGDVHRLRGSSGWIKFRTPRAYPWPLTTTMHADTEAPPPWPLETPHVANMNWILTPYSQENGALAYVPESHKRGCQPPLLEAREMTVPVVAPAGSMIFFHGATWHGGFRKETEGLRLSIHGPCCQPHYVPDDDYRGRLQEAAFARNADPDYLRMVSRENDPWPKRFPDSLKPASGNLEHV